MTKRVHFIVPSHGTPCGLAEYTDYLVSAMPEATVSAEPIDLTGIDVLHVQHEHSLFDLYMLPGYLAYARRVGVEVVVTEHSVLPKPSEFEQYASAIVALSEHGANLLLKRVPRVAHIPHHCPDWFPPRKRSLGRTVGLFGFLSPYKGFYEVIDTVAKMPDTRVLALCHDRLGNQREAWERRIAGKPVEWVPDFLPIEESARRLARECDALAYWYPSLPFGSASGAVRVGLATGVPIVASPANWLEELGDTVHRATDLREGLERILTDTQLRKDVVANARRFCREHSWEAIAERHRVLYDAL